MTAVQSFVGFAMSLEGLEEYSHAGLPAFRGGNYALRKTQRQAGQGAARHHAN